METPFKRGVAAHQFAYLTEEEFELGEGLWRVLGEDVNAMLSTDRDLQKRRLSAIVSMVHARLASVAASIPLPVSTSASQITNPTTPPPGPSGLSTIQAGPSGLTPTQKPIKLDVAKFHGKEGENLLRWLTEMEVAMGARVWPPCLIQLERLKDPLVLVRLEQPELEHECARAVRPWRSVQLPRSSSAYAGKPRVEVALDEDPG